jgi:hypothetical protein
MLHLAESAAKLAWPNALRWRPFTAEGRVLPLNLFKFATQCVVFRVGKARRISHVIVSIGGVDQFDQGCVSSCSCTRDGRHQTISKLARLAARVFTPTPTNAIVTSSSLRVSFEVTTTPVPKCACCTRSPSRKYRSPGMRTRAGLLVRSGNADSS